MSVPQILDASGVPVSAEQIAAARASAFGGPSHGAYRAASLHSQELASWRPPFTSADSAVLPALDLTAARVRDTLRNDPHAQSGVSKLVDMLIGSGLRYSAKPNLRALGLNPDNAGDREKGRDLALSMQSEFQQFAEDPRKFSDAQRKLSLNGLFRLAAKTMVSVGETTGFLTLKDEAGARYATCLRLIDPDRVSNPQNRMDSKNLRRGVELDDDGAPIAYHVRNAHPGDQYLFPGAITWTRIPRVSETGRPVFIHGFEPDREDQTRAMTPFAALMERLHMIGKHGQLEIANATVNALYAAFVESSMPVAEATQAFTPQTVSTLEAKRLEYWENSPPRLAGVRIPVMPIGDRVTINSAPRTSTSFAHFQAAFLQSIAAALGISYEQLSMDWSRVNYSSARAALNEVWRHIKTLLAIFIEQVVSPIHYAVIEEAFDRGYLVRPHGAPDFWDAPAAYLRAKWIGPPRGYVDPLKEAEGASSRLASVTSTLEQECAEQGSDWEEVVDQYAFEEELLKKRGITRVFGIGSNLTPDPAEAPASAAQPQGA